MSISRARLMAPTAELKKHEGFISLAHVEDRMCAAFAMNSSADARHWVGEWVALCRGSRSLDARLRWLIDNLLRGRTENGGICMRIDLPLVECR